MHDQHSESHGYLVGHQRKEDKHERDEMVQQPFVELPCGGTFDYQKLKYLVEVYSEMHHVE